MARAGEGEAAGRRQGVLPPPPGAAACPRFVLHPHRPRRGWRPVWNV
ncbi:hypothetical protein [Azospirillum doebereinerae]